MRVLIAAYACEPNRGSEPAVGWNWAWQAASRHEVWVLTRANNRRVIEDELSRRPARNLHFVYHDLPHWALLGKRLPLGLQLYFVAWQITARRLAVQLHARVNFDVCHQLTFVSMRFPTAVSTVATPSVWGPVAGGDAVPRRLLLTLGLRGVIHEVLRATTLRLVIALPALREERRKFSLVIAATPATARLLEKELPGRVIVQPAIGSEVHQRHVVTTHSALRLLYVGKLLPLKGLHFAIRALAELHSSTSVRAVLTVVGDGHDIGRLSRLAEELRISECVRFVGPLPYRTIQRLYAHHDVFVFPSLHDSGGLALLEAMSAGLPVVTLDLGGPSLLVTAESGIKVAPTTPSHVVNVMSSAFQRLATDSTLRKALGEGAVARATALSWSRIADELDDIYGSVRISRPLKGDSQ